MYANYHTHTWRCGHAHGTEREYIERAIRGGLKIFGFSDHTPQVYDGDYYPVRQKMRPELLEDYVDTILSLKKEYERDIKIYLGLEVEYFPKHFEDLMDLLAPYPIEYLLLGQHYVLTGLPDDVMVFRPTSDENALIQYVRSCIAAIETGRFLYVAHPDVLDFTGDETAYRREMKKLCLRAKELDIPLEFNLLGLGGGRNYPNPVFWEIAAECGNKTIFGMDAHELFQVCDEKTIARAETIVEKLGLNLLNELKI